MSVVARKIVNPEPMPPKSRKPHLPTPKEIWKQARHDWFGKDVQETPTVSYVWTADQFGHVGLGFQITFLFAGLALLSNLSTPWTLTIAAAVNFAIWVTKEIYDYIRERKKATAAESVFPFNGKEILWNVFTALFYILVGAIVAGAIPFGVWSPLVTLVILLLPAALLGLWWLRRKIVFQQAGLPYLYRLANFPVPIPESTVDFIKAMCDPNKPGPRHLVVGGKPNTGKSCLATGIGTEFAFRCGIGRYTTLAKLLELMDTGKEFKDGRTLWPWDQSDLLIVDDVDKVFRGTPLVADVKTIEPFLQYLRSKLPRDLKDRRTIWVVEDSDNVNFWQETVAKALQLDRPALELRGLWLQTTVASALATKAEARKAQK